jgi:hypothetical protein
MYTYMHTNLRETGSKSLIELVLLAGFRLFGRAFGASYASVWWHLCFQHPAGMVPAAGEIEMLALKTMPAREVC